MLKIGVPKEIKPMEGRVSLVPSAVAEIVHENGVVYIEKGAGEHSGFDDQKYRDAGATLLDSADALFASAELIVKVKEPIADDLRRLRPNHLLFCYLHLAANRELLAALKKLNLLAIAFETVESKGSLPLLMPMSEIAGRVAVQSAAHWLHASMGGRGILLGGATATERGHVAVLGAGTAGTFAIKEAAAMGANITVFDLNADALRRVRELGPNITALYPSQGEIQRVLQTTDLLVGAVLVPGASAPKLVTREMVKGMPTGSVIVDIAIDQGGCVETIRPTDYRQPTYIEEGVLHVGVTNLPSAVPRTSSEALSAAILPYVLQLAQGKLRDSPALKAGINVENGKVVHPALISSA
jgi:alanine dehydrogenase